MFLNGTRVATATVSNNFSSTNAFYIGRQAASTATTFTGYISNLRTVKGSSVYNPALTSLTVPTAPLTAVTNTALLSLQNNVPATNNGFVDSSALLNPVTRVGTPTQGSFAPFGTLWSNYFGGTGNYLQTGTVTAIPITQSTFTVEAWVYMTATPTAPYGVVVGDMSATVDTNYWSFGINSSNRVAFYWYSGSANNVSGSTTIALNTWYHIAISVNTNAISMYVNGVAQTLSGTTTLSNRTATLNYLSLAQTFYISSAAVFSGYISNLRVVSGTAVYTGGFTPSAVPLTAISGTSLLTCQTNRFQDTSTNALTLTATGTPRVQTFNPFLPTTTYSTAVQGGSAYFNGSSDYLTGPNLTLATTTTPFTVELWVFATTQLSGTGILSYNFPSGNVMPFVLCGATSLTTNTTGSNLCAGFYSGSAWGGVSSSTSLVLNTWNHIALSYNGTVATLYLNGVSIGTATTAWVTGSSTYTTYIGRRWDTGGTLSYFNGYLSNVRYTLGTAVYTAAFTPPTAPLTPIAKTSLLLNTANAGLFDYAIGNDLVTIGSTTVSTSTIKYGTGSLYFNGTSSYLTAPNNLPFVLGTTDFTIECWVYTNSSATQRIISTGNIGGAPYDFVLVNSTTNVYVDFFDGTTDITTGTNYVPQNQWVYLAVTRQGTAVKVFINGAVSGSGTSSVNLTANGTATIGRYSQAASGYFSGYISDLRITKGVARYTAAFTPPTTALPNY